MDDRHLRSGAEPGLRRHRQSDAGAERPGASRRQPLDRAASSRSIPTPASWRGASRPRRTTRTTGTRPKCRCWSTRTFNGEPRKMLMQASRNGYFFVLDRTNGKNLLTTPFAAVNWAKGIDAERPPDSRIRRRSRRATAVLVAPERRRRAPTTGRRASIPTTGLLHRQRAGRLRHLLLQAGARRLRLGRRRLRRRRQGRAARDRLPDRQDALEPRPRRRRGGAGRADDRRPA